AVQKDGMLAAWGGLDDGEMNPPLGLSNVVSAAAGNLHILALKKDGSVVAWGDNEYGQRDVPTGLRNVVSVAAAGSLGGDAGGDVSFALVAEPQLNIPYMAGNTATISWPEWSGNSVLQYTTNLLSNNWSTVTNTPVLTNNQFSVTWTNASGPGFFRLRQ
ncbi:MAG TPA: RCC1 domain-containing protein, partial [Candidatus Polarisedimenticolia bacterium]|nr:RCC1 domain-containing protein [Candidatus Polarisedimenticolia bacterium]